MALDFAIQAIEFVARAMLPNNQTRWATNAFVARRKIWYTISRPCENRFYLMVSDTPFLNDFTVTNLHVLTDDANDNDDDVDGCSSSSDTDFISHKWTCERKNDTKYNNNYYRKRGWHVVGLKTLGLFILRKNLFPNQMFLKFKT